MGLLFSEASAADEHWKHVANEEITDLLYVGKDFYCIAFETLLQKKKMLIMSYFSFLQVFSNVDRCRGVRKCLQKGKVYILLKTRLLCGPTWSIPSHYSYCSILSYSTIQNAVHKKYNFLDVNIWTKITWNPFPHSEAFSTADVPKKHFDKSGKCS